MADSPLKAIAEFFGYPTLGKFASDWKQLDENERKQIRGGIEDGSFSY